VAPSTWRPRHKDAAGDSLAQTVGSEGTPEIGSPPGSGSEFGMGNVVGRGRSPSSGSVLGSGSPPTPGAGPVVTGVDPPIPDPSAPAPDPGAATVCSTVRPTAGPPTAGVRNAANDPPLGKADVGDPPEEPGDAGAADACTPWCVAARAGGA
jgi:hypothetical protein